MREVSLSYDVITLSRFVNKVNLTGKGQFRGPQSLTYLASNSIKLGMHLFTTLTVIFQKRLKIEESARQKMGAEQRQ